MSKKNKFVKQARLPQAAYDQNRSIASVQNAYGGPRKVTDAPNKKIDTTTPQLPLTTLEEYCRNIDAAINNSPARVLRTRNEWQAARFFVMWQDGKGVKIQLEVKKSSARGLDIRAHEYLFLDEWDKIVKAIQQRNFQPLHEVIITLEKKIINYTKPNS